MVDEKRMRGDFCRVNKNGQKAWVGIYGEVRKHEDWRGAVLAKNIESNEKTNHSDIYIHHSYGVLLFRLNSSHYCS